MVRGDLFRLPSPRGARGAEQQGARYGVVVQSDELLPFRTILIAPTSTRARPTSFRPVIDLDGTETRVLAEQTTVVDPQRLGRFAGRLTAPEARAVDDALSVVLSL